METKKQTNHSSTNGWVLTDCWPLACNTKHKTQTHNVNNFKIIHIFQTCCPCTNNSILLLASHRSDGPIERLIRWIYSRRKFSLKKNLNKMTLCESQANARHGIIKSVCSTDKCGPIRFLRIDIRSMVGERKFTVVFLFKHKQSRSSPYISFLLHTVSPKFCVNVLEHGRWSYCSLFTHRLFNNYLSV